MKQYFAAFAVGVSLSACSGDGTNPFDTTATTGDTTTTDTGDTGTDIDGDRTMPPGTASPTADASIFRSEPTSTDGGNNGDGSVSGVTYNAASDTFVVDGLAFDGDNTYARGTNVSSLGPYAVYEASAQVTDPSTGTPINQFTHRAIYGISNTANTQFAIVRTGAYADFGFGGFVYQREGGVTLPSTGQAAYSGSVSGIRDFSGAGGLQYSTADINIAIDFDDFDDTTGTRGDGVQGSITNRTIFDINGNDVTQSVIDGINTNEDASLTAIPTALFTVGPGVLDDNGELLGTLSSTFVDNTGEVVQFETGNYYAVVSGDNADEIVGIVVLTTSVGQPDGVTVRDTGGFIVYR
ncbi:MAG: hypothetical protein AAFR45_10345 [Pseudomonadota bacterium]